MSKFFKTAVSKKLLSHASNVAGIKAEKAKGAMRLKRQIQARTFHDAKMKKIKTSIATGHNKKEVDALSTLRQKEITRAEATFSQLKKDIWNKKYKA